MGLLDLFNQGGDQQNQPQGLLGGLLASPSDRAMLAAAAAGLQASGPSLMPVSTGQVMGRMVNAGLGAYDSGVEQQQRQAMGTLKMKAIQGELEDQQRARDQADRLRQFYTDYWQKNGGATPAQSQAPSLPAADPSDLMASAMPGGPMSPKIGGPDWMQAYQASRVGGASAPVVPQGLSIGQGSPRIAPPDWMQSYQSAQAGGQASPDSQIPASQIVSAVNNGPAPAQVPASSGPAAGASLSGLVSDPYQQRMALANALRARGFNAEADAQELAALKFRPEYSTEFRVARGTDGKLHNYQLSKDGGAPKDTGLDVAPNLTEVDLGDRKTFVDKNGITPGTTYKIYQSPDSAAVDRRAAADRASGGTEASLNNATLDFLSDQALRGDKSVFQNLGRGAQGAANLVALRQRITEKAAARGITGADLAAITADYGGQSAALRTSGNISARVENAAAEAAQLAPLAIAAGRTVARSGFLPFGKAQVMFDSTTNDPNLSRFATANIGLANAYAGAMSRGQKPTVDDYQHARELLSTAKSQDAYEAIVGQMQQEIKAAQAAPQHVRANLRSQVSGQTSSQEPVTVPNPVAPAAGQFVVKAPNGKTYTFSNAKDLANFKLKANIQ